MQRNSRVIRSNGRNNVNLLPLLEGYQLLANNLNGVELQDFSVSKRSVLTSGFLIKSNAEHKFSIFLQDSLNFGYLPDPSKSGSKITLKSPPTIIRWSASASILANIS